MRLHKHLHKSQRCLIPSESFKVVLEKSQREIVTSYPTQRKAASAKMSKSHKYTDWRIFSQKKEKLTTTKNTTFSLLAQNLITSNQKQMQSYCTARSVMQGVLLILSTLCTVFSNTGCHRKHSVLTERKRRMEL